MASATLIGRQGGVTVVMRRSSRMSRGINTLRKRVEVAAMLSEASEQQIIRADTKAGTLLAGLSAFGLIVGYFLSTAKPPFWATLCGYATLASFVVALVLAAQVVVPRGRSTPRFANQQEAAAVISKIADDLVEELAFHTGRFYNRTRIQRLKNTLLRHGYGWFTAGASLGFVTLVLFRLGW